MPSLEAEHSFNLLIHHVLSTTVPKNQCLMKNDKSSNNSTTFAKLQKYSLDKNQLSSFKGGNEIIVIEDIAGG